MKEMKITDRLYVSWAYADMIVEEASKKQKLGLFPELEYEELVQMIASWMNCWMRFTMPRPGELIDLMSDAFLLVMRATKKELNDVNYEAFAEALRADVYRRLMVYLENCDKGVREFFHVKL